KNYTGDRLNFGLAAELARQQGIPAEILVVADDVSLRELVKPERRRGIAGTVLVHKLAGAAAERGLPLAALSDIARKAAAQLASMGVGLGACIVPAAGVHGFELGENEIEFGLGIHGEKGVERTNMRSADEITAALLDVIVEDQRLAPGTQVAVLVNGLGGTAPMELAIMARAALSNLRARGIVVSRAWSGNFMTAMEMPGCSRTLLPLDEEREGLLDAPTSASAWPGSGRVSSRRSIVAAPPQPAMEATPSGPLSPRLKRLSLAVAAALEAAEAQLTDLDSRSGDGDLGASMVRVAAAIRAMPDESYATPARLLADLGNAVRRAIAGSSGPFYAVALLRASARLHDIPQPDAVDWLGAFEAGIEAIVELGGARPGDRTMIDALVPAAEAWRTGGFTRAADAAARGAEATSDMFPNLGRASYLGQRAVGTADGGATAVAIWLAALSRELASE